MFAKLTNPDEIFAFGFILGCLSGYAFAKMLEIGKRMNERNKQ